MVTTSPETLWIRAKLDLAKRPIWFESGVPIGIDQAARFELGEPRAKCWLYTELDCAPLAQMPPGHRAATVPVQCLHTLVERSATLSQLGSLLEAQSAFKDPSFMKSLPRAAESFSKWEQDGTLAFFRSCYQLLYEAFKRPLEWIRDEYAQYWLPNLPPFIEEDQVTGRFGEFLDTVHAEWSLDRSSWERLRFSIVEQRASAPIPSELLTSSDWSRLSRELTRESDLTLHLISRARSAFDARDHRTAIINAITAVEREVARFTREGLADRGIKLSEKQFGDLSREAGVRILLETLVSALGEADEIHDISRSVDRVAKANTLRNKLVHGRQRDVSRDQARESLEACEELLMQILPATTRLRNPRWIPWDSK